MTKAHQHLLYYFISGIRHSSTFLVNVSVTGWCRFNPNADRLEAEQTQFKRYLMRAYYQVDRQAGR